MILENFFNPKSIAFVGATDRSGSVGLGICHNLLEGAKKRKIFFVNPNKEKVLGRKTYSSLVAIKGNIDLVIIAVPALIVPRIIEDCVEKKVGGVIIISAGFAEIGKEGVKRQQRLSQRLKEAHIPFFGPNCLGLIVPKNNLNASFAPTTPKDGRIALISQSGALIDSIIDISENEFYGFSKIISLGNEAGLNLNDFLKYLKNDEATKVIILYVEEINQGREFLRIAKSVVSKKPVIVLKAGKTKLGKKAVQSHTGSLAGSAEIYSAAFHQTGMIEVDTLEEMLDLAKALSWQGRSSPGKNKGIAIVTNGGGCGILATDYCQKLGIKLTPLSVKVLKQLDQSKLMNPAYSRRNPLDIVGDALADRYQIAINTLLEQNNIQGLIILQTLQVMTEVRKNAKIIVVAHKKYPQKPIVCCFLGGRMSREGIEILEKNHIPNYPDILRAVKTIKYLIN